MKYEILQFFSHCPAFTPVRYLSMKRKLRPEAIQTIEELHEPFSEELCRDMIWKYCAHMISMNEYFRFDCANHSYREIEEYIGIREKNYWILKMNRFSDPNIFKNKYETYCRLKPYYKREIIRVQSEEDFSEFCHFILARGNIIVKPMSGSCGMGVHRACGIDTERKARAVFNQFIRYPGGFLAEEIVRQSSEMAELHPQSVNTVRIMTICHRDYVRIWHPFLKIGKGDCIVDNTSQGGIQCVISPDTGIVGKTWDSEENRYDIHPDTGKQLNGFQIPHWDEAIALAKKIAVIFPQTHLIGWDLALTDKGWVVIEGNWAPGLGFQGIEMVGLKKEFREELKQIRKNK